MALYVMGTEDALDRDNMIGFVMSCWDNEVSVLDDLCLSVMINLDNSQVHLGHIQTTMHICSQS